MKNNYGLIDKGYNKVMELCKNNNIAIILNKDGFTILNKEFIHYIDTTKLNPDIDLSTYTYEYSNTFIRRKKLDKLLS